MVTRAEMEARLEILLNWEVARVLESVPYAGHLIDTDAALDEVPLHPEREEHPPEQESNPWRYELSERLEKLRERRERARNSFDPSTSLELGFNGSGEPAEAEPGPSPITAAP